MERVKAFIEVGDDGMYSVYVDLENKTLNYGIHGTGETAREAIDDFNSAYEAMKQFHKAKEKDFVEATFSFQYDVASFLEYYANVFSKPGLEMITGINQKQFFHYQSGKKPRKETILKIQEGLHKLGKELTQVHFID